MKATVRYKDTEGRLKTFRGEVVESEHLPGHLNLVDRRKIRYISKKAVIELIRKKKRR